MNGKDDIDLLAAEYVLGTLDASARTALAARRQREPALDAAIRAWEGRLGPLGEEVRPVEPPAGLLGRIEARIAGASAAGADRGRISSLEAEAGRWRRAAVAASALAASLALFIGVRELVYPPKPETFVAVFQKDDAQPAFVLSVDLATRQMTIRPVTAERQPGKSYQLWIVGDRIGTVPRSLGLIDDTLAPTRKSLADYEPAVLQNATFGVSVEPAGGSPTGRPTGAAIHGKLIPAKP
jgi:anti-sigma-K factor RskA